MKTASQKLADEIEAVASILNMSPSTVGERAGQGGKFYERLRSGRRVWPETIEKVQVKLRDLLAAKFAEGAHDKDTRGAA
jgi:hypothetical protein